MNVVKYPDQVLFAPTQAVTTFDAELKALAEAMAETMYAERGVGLAAPQVNISKRFVVVDPTAGDSANSLVALVNPIITWASPEQTVGEEGCLSLPGVSLQVTRSVAIDVEYDDLQGNRIKQRCTDWTARIVQHEVNHLDGLLMVDKVGSLARRLALKNLTYNR